MTIETPTWRNKERIGSLMTRLQRHAQGEIDMTKTQIAAAKLYLSKTLPDLASMEHVGDAAKPISHVVTWDK